MTRCPSCDKDVNENARHCGYCGARISRGSPTAKKTVLGMAIPAEELERRKQMLDEAIAKEKARKAGAAPAQENSGDPDAPARTLLMAQYDPSETTDLSEPADPTIADGEPKATALMPAAQIRPTVPMVAEPSEPTEPVEPAGQASSAPAQTALLAQVEPAVEKAAAEDKGGPAVDKQTRLLSQASRPKPASKPSAPQVRKTMMMGSLQAQLKEAGGGLDEWPDPSGWDLGGDAPSFDDALATGPTLEEPPAGVTAPLRDLGHAETDEIADDWDPMATSDADEDAAAESGKNTTDAGEAAAEPSHVGGSSDEASPAPESASAGPDQGARKTVPVALNVDAAAAGPSGPKRRAGRPTDQRAAEPKKKRGMPTANVRRHMRDEGVAGAPNGQPSALKWLVGVAIVVILVATLLGVGLLILLN